MTNDEAIKYLEYLKDNYTRKGAPMCHAVETAIEALKPQQAHTNADRIRKMTDEQLAEMLDIYDVDEICSYCAEIECTNECYKGILKWLKQEVLKNDSD